LFRFAQTVEVSDVQEAYRLILSAMQTAAIDPVTGQLDYDLIVTGHSARERREFNDKKKSLMDLFNKQTGRKISWSTAEVSHMFKEHLQVGTTTKLSHVSEHEMRDLLEALTSEGIIAVSGDTVTKI
jgi:DNA replication licensing factor MCM4